MRRDSVLFLALSDCFTKLENPHYYHQHHHGGHLAGHGTSPEEEHHIRGNVKPATINPGGVKVDDNCLLLDFQGHDAILDPPSMLSSTCSSINSQFRSSSSSSLSLLPSSSTFLSFPSSSLSHSSPSPVFCDGGVNEEIDLSECELIVSQTIQAPSDVSMPPSAQSSISPLSNNDIVDQSLLLSSADLSMPPSAQSNHIHVEPPLLLSSPIDLSASLDPCFDVPHAEEALVPSPPKEACLEGEDDIDDDDVLSSLIMSNTYPSSQGSSLDLVQEPQPICVIAHDDELSMDDIVAKDSFGTSSSLGGGCPNAILAITDDCSDLLGSSRQHQSLQDKLLHLHVHQGSGNMYQLPKHHRGSSSALDAFGRLNLSPSDSHGEFLLPSLTRGNKSSITELEKTCLYNLSDSKDLIFTGVESVFSENPQSLLGSQGFYQYTKEEKGKRIDRYRQKRSSRNFSKKIKYACRKALADSRPRVRGRFAKTEEGGGGGGGGGGWDVTSTEQGRWSWRSLPSPPPPPSPFVPSYMYPSRMGLTSYHI